MPLPTPGQGCRITRGWSLAMANISQKSQAGPSRESRGWTCELEEGKLSLGRVFRDFGVVWLCGQCCPVGRYELRASQCTHGPGGGRFHCCEPCW